MQIYEFKFTNKRHYIYLTKKNRRKCTQQQSMQARILIQKTIKVVENSFLTTLMCKVYLLLRRPRRVFQNLNITNKKLIKLWHYD